jgi:hypothetical protein
MLSANGTLTGITRNGSAIPDTTQTIKGIDYAFFSAIAGATSALSGHVWGGHNAADGDSSGTNQ